MVVPLSVGVLGGTPDTYHPAGLRRGTATNFHDYRDNLSETLDTFSHLWPDNQERARAAVDEVLGASKRREHGAGSPGTIQETNRPTDQPHPQPGRAVPLPARIDS